MNLTEIVQTIVNKKIQKPLCTDSKRQCSEMQQSQGKLILNESIHFQLGVASHEKKRILEICDFLLFF